VIRRGLELHTRTKTGRAPELNAAAPEPWVELAPSDAADLAVKDGSLSKNSSQANFGKPLMQHAA
jgi:ferredoxin-nitrate reductase